jgi:hypothetical protein
MFKRFLIVLFFVLSGIIGSQCQTFRNPYSFYGIGELQEKTFTSSLSLGGISYGWNDRFSVTPLNPASYSNLEFATFDLGIKGKIQNLIQEDIDIWNNTFSFNYFSLGFPVYRKIGWGSCIGLIPISKIGYKSTYLNMPLFADSIFSIETFDNTGGFSEFFIGNSFTFFKKINFGVNLAYYFGNKESQHNLTFYDYINNLSVFNKTTRDYQGIGADFGFQYTDTNVGKQLNLTIGAAFSLPVNLKMRQEHVIYTYRNYASGNDPKDTLMSLNEKSGNLIIPLSGGIGFILSKEFKWKAGVDIKYENWSAFKSTENNFKLHDQWTISAGGEIIPKYDALNYLKVVAYRLGFKYTSSFIDINGTNINKYSITLGAGFPVFRNLSNINLGVELGTGGKTGVGLIKENYINIFLGFRLNDIWFIKPKID